MKNYRPLLLQELDLRLPGLRVRRMRLHRHLPEVDMLSEHGHTFSQILCYLSGRGTLRAAGVPSEIHPGSVVFLPPRLPHSFEETQGRRPLCLVLDLEWRGAAKRGLALARLSQSDAGSIRHDLSELTRLRDPNELSSRLVVGSVVLRILDRLLRGFQLLPPRQTHAPSFVREFDRVLRQPENQGAAVKKMAQQLGYQPDYLNRIFKQTTGQTLREYRDALRLAQARRLLRDRPRVRDVCEEMGFYDQNYFARWFKKHAGISPTAFSRSP